MTPSDEAFEIRGVRVDGVWHLEIAAGNRSRVTGKIIVPTLAHFVDSGLTNALDNARAFVASLSQGSEDR